MATHTGIKASASFTPTAAEYTAADSWGGAQEFKFTLSKNGIALPANSTIRITSSELRIDHTALVASEGAYTLHLYTITPPSAIADNAAFTHTSADLPYYVGSIAIGTPVDGGAALFVKAGALTHDVAVTSASLFGYLVNAATCTPTAVARQIKLIGNIV